MAAISRGLQAYPKFIAPERRVETRERFTREIYIRSYCSTCSQLGVEPKLSLRMQAVLPSSSRFVLTKQGADITSLDCGITTLLELIR